MTEYIVQQLRSVIIHSLDNDLLTNAEFTCERLIAIDPTNLESIYLYGLVLFKQGKFQTSFNVTANRLHLGCSYIFAKSCVCLEMPNEGIFQLKHVSSLWDSNTDVFNHDYEFDRRMAPDASSIHHLLGNLYRAIGDVQNAALSYSTSLKLNRYNFSAFEELAKLGVNFRVKSIYKPQFPVSSEMANPFSVITPVFSNSIPLSYVNPDDSFNSVTNNIKSQAKHLNTTNHTTSNATFDFSNPLATPRLKQPILPDAPTRKSNRLSSSNPPTSSSGEFTKPNYPIANTSNNNGADSVKKSKNHYSKITSRLISQPTSSTNTNNNTNTSNGSTAGSKRDGLKRNKFSSATSNITTSTVSNNGISKKEIEQGELYLLSLYTMFGKAFKSMCKYDCFKAIRILEQLPEREKNTPWVLGKLGRLHFEIVNYKDAVIFFQKLRQLDRTRLEDMEYYSTLLWHLQKKIELSHLAHDLYDIDSNSGITWCAIGNLFSLNREPDEAIKCFQKATKLNKNLAYAFTLQGHEYVSNDSYENALESFRNSLLIDPRHYNSLYGIGMVYLKIGDFARAEYHFRKAVSINPVNVILICCVGMVLEKLGKKSAALKQYELAYKLQPLSALPLFKKAQLLFSLQEYSQSLKDFEKLRELAPDEASVHFLLGQLYKINGEKMSAIKEFTIALNLDPKGSHLIKEAMENLDET